MATMETLKFKRIKILTEIAFCRDDAAIGGPDHAEELKKLRDELHAIDKEMQDVVSHS